MSPVKVEISRSDAVTDVAVMRIEGALDIQTLDQLKQGVQVVLDGGYVYLVADMTRVESISSAAVGELLGCRRQMLERDGELVLAALSLYLQEQLTAMDVNKIFRFYPSVKSAVNAYSWEYRDRSEDVRVRFPSELRFVPSIRQFVSRVAKQKGYGSRDSFRIETIVDEICNNAVEHGSPDRSCLVDVTVKIDRRKIELKVVNMSDPAKVEALREVGRTLQAPDETALSKRGRGLALVKMLSTDFSIDSSDVGTSVHVTKLRED